MLKLDNGQKPVSVTCLWFGHTVYPYVLFATGFPAVLVLQPKMFLKLICSVLCCLTEMLFGSLKCGPQIC